MVVPVGGKPAEIPQGRGNSECRRFSSLAGYGVGGGEPLFFPLVSGGHYLWSMASGKGCISVLSGPHR